VTEKEGPSDGPNRVLTAKGGKESDEKKELFGASYNQRSRRTRAAEPQESAGSCERLKKTGAAKKAREEAFQGKATGEWAAKKGGLAIRRTRPQKCHPRPFIKKGRGKA